MEGHHTLYIDLWKIEGLEIENFDRGIKEIKQDTKDKWFMLSSRDQVRHEIKIIHGIGV